MALEKQFLKSRPVCKVRFTIAAEDLHGASSASVVGEFNDWNPEATPMKPQKDGAFSVLLEIPAGREYRFRYFLDKSRWVNEVQADGYEYCPFAGVDNSLLNI